MRSVPFIILLDQHLASAWPLLRLVLPFSDLGTRAVRVSRPVPQTNCGVVNHLRDCKMLAEVIELRNIPHFTTLQKALRRLVKMASVRALLDETRSFQRSTTAPQQILLLPTTADKCKYTSLATLTASAPKSRP